MQLNSLSHDILVKILSFAGIKDVYNFTCTSRQFYPLINDKQVLYSSLVNSYCCLTQEELDKLLFFHVGCIDQYVELRVRALLKAGANPNAKNKHSLTPIYYTMHRKVAELLLEAGINKEIYYSYSEIASMPKEFFIYLQFPCNSVLK